MIMEEDPTYFEELIARYFSGEATSAEINELSAWVGENPEHETIFRESRYAWMACEEARLAEAANVDQEWEAFINCKEVRGEIHKGSHDGSSLMAHDSSLMAHGSSLMAPDLRVLPITSLLLRVAAVLVILAVPLFFLYRYLEQPVIKELSANTGRMETLLPDGSRVTLNSGAVIKYPEKFNGKNRTITLDGEAYFEVAHNTSKPFIIATDGLRVEVKGTSFYINTHSWSGDFELVLTTGEVKLYFENKAGQSRVLNPGEKANVHGHQIVISNNQDANYMAWKTRKVTFNNDPLNSVAATLSKVYQANIYLGNPSLAQCRLTATFDNQSLVSVLNVLKATLDIDIRSSGSLVEISGKGCR